MEYVTADIRRFLVETFSDEELKILCFDYFRDVYDDFTTGMTKGRMIQLLIERCDRRGALANLDAALAAERPAQYATRFGAPEPAGLPAEPPPAGRDPRQVFISHAHQDADFAHRLAADLASAGWRAWIAPRASSRARSGSRRSARAGRQRRFPCRARRRPRSGRDGSEPKRTRPSSWKMGGRGAASSRWRSRRVPCPRCGMTTSASRSGPLRGRLAGADLVGRSAGGQAGRTKHRKRQGRSPAFSRRRPHGRGRAPPRPIAFDWVTIPAGEFLMGSDKTKDKLAYDDETPQHTLYLPEYRIAACR